MNAIKARIAALLTYIQRYPRAMALISFLMGVASFFLVNRQNGSAALIAAALLLSWLWLILENLLTRKISQRFDLELSPTLLHFGTQVIHQESLFFVLPFFLITTTWNSGQLVFTGMLIVAALLSIIDPFYYRWLAVRRLIFMVFHTLTLFVVLLTALPVILHLTTDQSYRYATIATVVLAIPTLLQRVTTGSKFWGRLQFVTIIAVLASVLWYGRFFVPPATLWLTEVSISTELGEPNHRARTAIKTLTEQQLQTQGLYAYTAIRAPRGLGEKVFHVWVQDGQIVDRIALTIKGGRKEGYRTWTHKRHFPAEAAGRWQIQVVTEAGQMIGVVRFEVTRADYSQSETPAGFAIAGFSVE